MKTTTTPMAAGLLLASLLITACGTANDSPEPEEETQEATEQQAEQQNDPRAWFEEHCPLVTVPVEEEETGDQVGTAMIQGPMRPPAGIADSSADLRIFTYDEIAGEMVSEGELSPDDLICFEQDMGDPERQMDHETEVADEVWDGDSGFIEVRDPHNEDGIWLAESFLITENTRKGVHIEENGADEPCETDWSAATDIIPTEEAEQTDEPITSIHVIGADC